MPARASRSAASPASTTASPRRDAGADAIGFVFWAGHAARSSPRERARAIAAALPPFVSIVGLFVDPTPEHVRAVLAAVPLDLLQFHGAEAPEFCRAFGRPYLKAVPVGANATGSIC